MYRKFFKRLFDIILSFIGIVILSIPMLIIACVIKIDSKGPAIFKHDRIGENGKIFKFYKFRSMSVTAPCDCATRNLKSENYITKVGAFLRKTSLDELPQLFNIIKGDMSIIGPRPVVTTETELIEARKRTGAHSIRAGLTGLAQISGRDTVIDMQYKAELDGLYAQNITFLGDMKIFFKTIVKVIKHDGIVEGEKVLTQPTIQTIPLSTPELASTTPPTTNAILTSQPILATLEVVSTIDQQLKVEESEQIVVADTTLPKRPQVSLDNIVALDKELRESTQNTDHTV